MKKSLILSIVFSMTIGLTSIANNIIVTNTTDNKIVKSKEFISSNIGSTIPPNIITYANLFVPYAENGLANSQLVISKDEYSIWRINSNELSDIPSCSAVGSSYKYFVFKEGDFLFTVNECNKSAVFDFFVD